MSASDLPGSDMQPSTPDLLLASAPRVEPEKHKWSSARQLVNVEFYIPDIVREVVIPFGYELWRDAIVIRRKEPQEVPVEPSLFKLLSDNGEHRKNVYSLHYEPLLIVARGMRIEDGRRYVKLMYLDSKRQWTAAWVDMAVISDRRRILELIRIIDINSEIAPKLVVYLAAFIEANVDRYQPIHPLVHRSGWVESHGVKGWYIGRQWVGINTTSEALQPELDTDDNSIRQSLHTSGRYDEWIGYTKELLEKHWIARFILGASFAAPLLRHLTVRTFLLHHWCETGGGKSALAMLGQTVWGGHKAFSLSANMTQLSAIGPFEHVTDLPILFDETEHDAIDNVRSMVYALAGERARSRLTQDGRPQEPTVPDWHSLIRFTGETRILDKAAPKGKNEATGGEAARCLELHHPGIGEEVAKKIHLWMERRRCYGHAGPDFLGKMIHVVTNDVTLERLRSRHERYSGLMREKANLRGPNADQVAAILVGEYLMLFLIYQLSPEDADATVLADMDLLAECFLETVDDRAPKPARLASYLLSHRQANPQRYIDLTTNESETRARMEKHKAHDLMGVEVFENGRRALWYLKTPYQRLIGAATNPKFNLRDSLEVLYTNGALVKKNGKHFASVRQRESVFSGTGRAEVYIVYMDALEKMAGWGDAQEEHPMVQTTSQTVGPRAAPADLVVTDHHRELARRALGPVFDDPAEIEAVARGYAEEEYREGRSGRSA